MAKTPKENLIELLRELFQLDNSDLDFGIYRILKLRSRDVEEFIEKVLPQKLEEVKKKLEDRASEEIKKDLDNVTTDLEATYGKGFETKYDQFGQAELFKEKFGKYKLLKEKLHNSRLSEDIENDIYNDLYRFFERYYEDGDFVTKPRAGDKTYMIPYDGEEVKLYWANYDQYYIKTGENFKNYVFTNGKNDDDKITVEFRIKDVETSVNNNQNEKGRLFIPTEEYFEWNEENKMLSIYFHYKKPTDTEKDNWGNKQTVKKDNKGINEQLILRLEKKIKGTKNKELLEIYYKEKEDKKLFYYHLNRYTALNKFDYFIHKDLKKFLTRELDYYLKNEIMSINFLSPEWKDEDVEQGIKLNVVKASAIRELAFTIIEFLDELENFQRRLFEKKKFVASSDYVVSVGMLKEEIKEDIVKYIRKDEKKAQIIEWMQVGYINDEDFKEGNIDTKKHLPIYTKYLPAELKYKFINSLENIEELKAGLLVESDNFHMLKLCMEKYKGKIGGIYIDPPYNTGDDEFCYKDKYKESSWITLLQNRIRLSKDLLNKNGKIGISIDDRELSKLVEICNQVFGNKKIVAVKMSEASGLKMAAVKRLGTIPKYKEYVVFSGKENLFGFSFESLQKSKWDDEYNKIIVNYSSEQKAELEELINTEQLTEIEIKKINEICESWEIKSLGEVIKDEKIKEDQEIAWKYDNAYRIIRTAAGSSVKELAILERSKYPNHRIFCALSKRDSIPYFIYNEFDETARQPRVQLLFAEDNLVVHPGDFWSDINTTGLEAEGKVEFKNGKKPLKLVDRIVKGIAEDTEYIMDYFAGSGTTGEAVININKREKKKIKYILGEINEYLESKVKQRINSSYFMNEKEEYFYEIIKLEQYEDTLNNIVFDENDLELEFEDKIKYRFREGAENSASIMMADKFEDPFNYQMEIFQQNERKLQPVDLATTFNFLLGIDVDKIKTEEHQNRTYRVITGKRKEQGYFIVWRKYDDKLKLDEERDWIKKLEYYDDNDKKYCNADNSFGAESTEIEFKRLMFEGVK